MDRGGGRGHRTPDRGRGHRRGNFQGQGRGGHRGGGHGNRGRDEDRAQNHDGQDRGGHRGGGRGNRHRDVDRAQKHDGKGRGRGGYSGGPTRVYKPVSYGLIEEKIEELSCEELLLWLLNDRGFESLLKLEKIEKPRLLISTLKAILRAMDSGRDGNSTQLLINVRDSPMFKSVPFILNLGFSLWSQREMTDIVDKLVCLLDIYMKILPTDSADVVEVIWDTLTLKLPKLSKLLVPDIVHERLDLVKENIDIYNEKRINNNNLLKKPEKKRAEDEGLDDLAPPEDFKTLSIFPTASDFEDKEIFLRKNLIGSPYKDLDTYLDVQFRLIREDFVRPLREGILEYKHCLQTGTKLKSKDVKIYEKTKILYPDITQSGLTYRIQFSLGALKSVRWANSKRLIYGSLVCLSLDGFNTFLFATIVNRDPKDLEQGMVDIKLDSNVDDDDELVNFNREYAMVESSSFFEAYRHVLKSLQEAGDNLPFQRYIVGEKRKSPGFFDSDDSGSEEDAGKVEIKYPRYLPFDAKYDLSPLMKEKYKSLGKNISLRNAGKWPHKDLMALDDSQLDAVKNSLTREVSIVQGPPGTGKTYIGLKIAEVLLLNSDFWNQRRGPILVLCYTNHALDQFLEGILKFNEEIVRVGSRSKNEALERFNISNLKRTSREHLSRNVRTSFAKIREQMKEHEQEMIDINARIEASRNHVLSENEIEHNMGGALEIIKAGCQTDFQTVGRQGKPKSCIQEWLGLGSAVIQENLVDEFVEMRIDGDNDVNGEENDQVDVKEDAEREQEQRFLDLEEDDVQNDALKELKEKKERAMNNVDFIRIVNEFENDGFKISKREMKRRKQFAKKELSKTSIMNKEERNRAERDPWRLSLSARWRLYRTWVSGYQYHLQNVHDSVGKKYIFQLKRLEEIKEIEMTNIIKRAKVVGMTTTGAARLHSVVKNIESTIMIVEEAAEVFEAHIVASLTASCQHLILIGDHQQLRPNPTVYELCKRYNLDVSLFERLIRSGLSHNRLDIQHRMLPAISKLIVPHIYKDLQDHESVHAYPAIKGVGSNLFFIDHNQKENAVQEGQSKVNEHEAKFLQELCRYFLKQGYPGEKITILTTYSGQLFAFKKLMQRKDFPGVTVTTVDNYQGEENDIILLSLVRSNHEGQIGFLKTDNRVCVALSRARHALIAIGNFVQLAEHSPLWRNIVEYLHNGKMIDSSLLLKSSCRHPLYEKVNEYLLIP